jgi:hypothetical protein
VPILHVPSRIAAAVVAARATRAASFGCGVAASLSICWWWCTRHCCDERRFCWTTNLGKCLIYVYFSCIEYKVLWDFVREPSPSTIPCCLGRCFIRGWMRAGFLERNVNLCQMKTEEMNALPFCSVHFSGVS